jgi:hypothetical protein
MKQFGVEKLDSDEDAEVPVHMKKAKDIEFIKNANGDFILPPKVDIKTNRGMQRVIRGYVGAVYRQIFSFSFSFILLI